MNARFVGASPADFMTLPDSERDSWIQVVFKDAEGELYHNACAEKKYSLTFLST